MEEGLLKQEEIDSVTWCSREDKVDFGIQYNNKNKVLRLAYSRFSGSEAFDRFCLENGSWLSDFALFMALKDSTGKSWYDWDDGLKFRDPDAIWKARTELKDDIRFYSFVQFLFDRQWNALRAYAKEAGISIIGDVPIYVPYDSVEVWASPELFQLDAGLRPTDVAGNPLYRWDEMKKDGYAWWVRRLAAAGKWYDTIRLDHFRGFESYWAVPYGAPNARGGRWVKGPGMDFIDTLKKALPELSLIAEDLGYLTQEVLDLRDGSGYPGMKVLGFAFDSREPSEYLPHTYTRNSVCYTGTHDNMTTRQWFDTADAQAVAYAREYMCLNETEGDVWVQGFISAVL